MKSVFVSYLFNHHYFVNQQKYVTDACAETRLSLANLFNIRITSGAERLQPVMIRTASELSGSMYRSRFIRDFRKASESFPFRNCLLTSCCTITTPTAGTILRQRDIPFLKNRSNAKYSMKRLRLRIFPYLMKQKPLKNSRNIPMICYPAPGRFPKNNIYWC